MVFFVFKEIYAILYLVIREHLFTYFKKPYMAHRQTKLKKHIKSKSSPKTKKRLLIKHETLVARGSRKASPTKTTA